MTTIRQNSTRAWILLVLFPLAVTGLHAQEWKADKKISVLFGLSQPLLLNGFNMEVNYIHNRMILDYSHGISLDFSENAVTPDLKDQGVVVHMPYSTGFGVGYRFAKCLNLRVEPKWHRFEFYYNNDIQTTANEIISYNTFTLGLGLYGSFYPFKNHESFIKGFLIAPSIRYWPTVSSTMEGGTYSYINKNTFATEEIKTLNPGMGFTPFIVNLSIGYSFDLRKKK